VAMGKERYSGSSRQRERHPEVASRVGGRLASARTRRGRCFVRGGRGQRHGGGGASATAGCDVVERRGGGFWAARAPHVVETGIRLRIVSTNRQRTRVLREKQHQTGTGWITVLYCTAEIVQIFPIVFEIELV
jgi:hypothetical protein